MKNEHHINQVNYYQVSLKEIEEIQKEFPDHKPSLLLHACCAVCAGFPLEFLNRVFDVTVYFNNSNIYPQEEYERRLSELKRYLQETCPEVKLITEPYDNIAYTEKLEPMKADPERGGRCFFCYATRMRQAYQYASDHSFDFFTTVMTISRQKDSQKLNQIGHSLSMLYPNVRYFYSDFKKNKGQDRGRELSIEHHLYRQDYCGCVYSWQQRQKQKEQQKK